MKHLAEIDALPVVSIIIRTKDRPKLLSEAIRSVLDQQYRPIELVVVNDGGEDVKAILDSLADMAGLSYQYLHLHDNVGRGAAANEGIKAASGDFVAFLDDDDLFLPAGIKTLVGQAKSIDMPILYGRVTMRMYAPDGSLRKDCPGIDYATPYDRQLLLIENYIPFNALLMPTESLREVGPIREDLPLLEDWELLLRLSDRFPFQFVDIDMAVYRSFGEVTATGGRFSAEQAEQSADLVRGLRWQEVTPKTFRKYSERLKGQFEWQLRDLQGTLSSTRQFLGNAEQEVASLRGLLTESNKHNQALQKCLNESEEQRKQLEGYLSGAEEEIAALRGFLTESNAHNQALQKCLNESEEQRKQLEGYLSGAEEEIAALRGFLTESNAHNQALQKCLNESEEQRKQLEGYLFGCEEQRKQLESYLFGCEEERKQLEFYLRNAEKELIRVREMDSTDKRDTDSPG